MADSTGSTTIHTYKASIHLLASIHWNTPIPSPYQLVTPYLYASIAKYVHALQCIIAVWGMLGNVLSMRTFLRIGLKDCVTITFFNLAISDFSILITIVLKMACSLNDIAMIEAHYDADNGTFSYYNTIIGLDPHLIFICVRSMANLFISVSSTLITFLAIQRSLCVIRPLHFKGLFTRGKAFAIVLLIWGYWLNITIAEWSFFSFGKTEHGYAPKAWRIELKEPIDSLSCQRFYSYHRLVNCIILQSIFLVVVLAGLSVLAIALVKSIRFRHTAANVTPCTISVDKDTSHSGHSGSSPVTQDEAESKQNAGTRNISKERKAILQVASLSLCFLLQQFPFIVWDIAIVILPELIENSAYFYLNNLFTHFCIIMYILNASVNFLVYYKFNTKFRSVCFQRKPN